MGGERRVALAVIVLTAGLLESCTVVPHRSPLPPAVPAAFPVAGGDSLRARWWEVLGDTSLDRLMEQSLARNFTIKSTWARLEQAAAIARSRGAARRPSVDLQGSITRTQRSAGGTGPEGTTWAAGAGAAYEVDLWSRLGSLAAAAELDRRASEADVATAALTLTAQVATTYFQLVEQQERLRLLERQRILDEKILALVQLRFRRGRARLADVLQQRRMLESICSQRARVHARRTVLAHALEVLLGQPPTASPWLPASAALPRPPPLPAPGLPSDLLMRRPDTRRAFLALEAADRNAAAAAAARFPRISLSAQSSTSAPRATGLFDTWVTNLAANLLLPVVDGGARKAEADRTRAVVRERLYAYRQSVLTALREVMDALAQERQQHLYTDSVGRQVALARQVVRRTQDEYLDGTASYLQVLEAVRTQQQLENTFIDARSQWLALRIGLHRALGGGWRLAGLETPR